MATLTETVRLRLSPDQKRMLATIAAANGRTKSAWLRWQIQLAGKALQPQRTAPSAGLEGARGEVRT